MTKIGPVCYERALQMTIFQRKKRQREDDSVSGEKAKRERNAFGIGGQRGGNIPLATLKK